MMDSTTVNSKDSSPRSPTPPTLTNDNEKKIERNSSNIDLLSLARQNVIVDPNLFVFTKPHTLTALVAGVSILIYFAFTRDETNTVTNVKL
jgi:hypothetical protein